MTENWMAPWLSLWNAPLSGDVSQMFRIFSPSFTVEGKGDPELEGRIVRDVATYGAQIGQLSEIALALAKHEVPPKEAVDKLQAISDKIADIKLHYRENAATRAKAALADYEAQDKSGYDALIASLGKTA